MIVCGKYQDGKSRWIETVLNEHKMLTQPRNESPKCIICFVLDAVFSVALENDPHRLIHYCLTSSMSPGDQLETCGHGRSRSIDGAATKPGG